MAERSLAGRGLLLRREAGRALGIGEIEHALAQLGRRLPARDRAACASRRLSATRWLTSRFSRWASSRATAAVTRLGSVGAADEPRSDDDRVRRHAEAVHIGVVREQHAEGPCGRGQAGRNCSAMTASCCSTVGATPGGRARLFERGLSDPIRDRGDAAPDGPAGEGNARRAYRGRCDQRLTKPLEHASPARCAPEAPHLILQRSALRSRERPGSLRRRSRSRASPARRGRGFLPGASQRAARERDAEGLVAGQRFEVRAVNGDTSAESRVQRAPDRTPPWKESATSTFHIAVEQSGVICPSSMERAPAQCSDIWTHPIVFCSPIPCKAP